MTPIHWAKTHLAENEAAAIDDGEGISVVRGPVLSASRYPPLGGLDRINRLDGLATHERIRERGHHRLGVLGLPSPQHQARGGIYTIAHDASLPQPTSPVTSVSPTVDNPAREPGCLRAVNQLPPPFMPSFLGSGTDLGDRSQRVTVSFD